MDKKTLQYIAQRAAESDNASIKAVSCADVRALLEEREAMRVSLRFLARAAQTEPEMSIYAGHIEHALKLAA